MRQPSRLVWRYCVNSNWPSDWNEYDSLPPSVPVQLPDGSHTEPLAAAVSRHLPTRALGTWAELFPGMVAPSAAAHATSSVAHVRRRAMNGPRRGRTGPRKVDGGS